MYMYVYVYVYVYAYAYAYAQFISTTFKRDQRAQYTQKGAPIAPYQMTS